MQLHGPTLAAVAVILAMSISLAWQTADWLRLVRTPVTVAAAPAAAQSAPEASQGLERLFGSAALSNDAPAPATHLRMTLLGSFVHSDPERSSAIIRSENGETQRYLVGSEIAGGVRLDRVYAGHVELLRNGRRESLAFAQAKHAASGSGADEGASALQQYEALESGNLEELRERMEALRQQMEVSGTYAPDTESTEQPTEGQ